MDKKIDRQFSLIVEILDRICEGCIEAIQEDYVVLTPLGSVTYEDTEDKWYFSFDLSCVTEVRHTASFALILLSFWEKNIPMFISESYYSLYDKEGFHIYALWESEIYQTMQDSGDDNYEIVKSNLIEFYQNQGIKDNIH